MHPFLHFTFALLLAGPSLAAPRHAVLLREATAAARTGDLAGALPKLEEAAQLRPDYPRVQLNLARVYTALQRPDDALAALERLATLGFQLNAAADPAFAAVKDSPDFVALAARLAAGPAPVTHSVQPGLALAGATGIIESCFHDPATGRWFFADVRQRCIWVQAAGGAPVKFTNADDALDGVFKLALSADGKTLWASTATVGVMTGSEAEDGKRSALIALDAVTGRVLSRHPVPDDGRKHLLGDFILASDGSLYVTDSVSPVIWRLAPGAAVPEVWLESDEFLSLQGIALDAANGTLYVADYANGIWRINLATKASAILLAPANASFFGVDGLYAAPGGLLAVQNGLNPQRVLRIEGLPVGSGLGPTSPPRSSPLDGLGALSLSNGQVTTLQNPRVSARILATGHPAMTDLGLGQIVNGRFHVVANSGWALFDPAPTTPPAPREVAVVSVAIE